MHHLLSSLASDFGIRFKKHLGYDKDQTSDLVWKRDEWTLVFAVLLNLYLTIIF